MYRSIVPDSPKRKVRSWSSWMTIFILLGFSALGCRQKAERQDILLSGLHCWNTQWNDSLMQLGTVKKFAHYYVHVFDVDVHSGLGEPIPSFTLDTLIAQPGKRYTPIAFLTPAAMDWYRTQEKVDRLAQRIDILLGRLADKYRYSFDDFVLDYDWKATDQAAYFEVLKALRKRLAKRNVDLTATLRLHQLQLSDEIAAPPVDKVLLMCYNMGNYTALQGKNSIYDGNDFKMYARGIEKYPLPLAYVLPVFDHVLLFRNTKFEGLLRQITAADLQENTSLFSRQAENIYTVNKDMEYKGFPLQKNDQIKYEYVDIVDLEQMINVLKSSEKDSLILSIFDLKHYTQNDGIQEYLQTIY